MPLNDRVNHSKWFECFICGAEYPIIRMVRQNGALVCTETCVDIRDHPGEAKVEASAQDEIRLPDTIEMWW